MSCKPFISIVIPLYNKEKSITKTLSSIFHQSFSDFEIVIVDDGSTDRSYQIVREFQAKNEKDVIIKLVQQTNAGPSSARNTGVRHASAEWIVFLDADDELLNDALYIFKNIITEHKDIDIIDANKHLRKGSDERIEYHPIEGYVKNPFKACFYGLISPGSGRSIFRRTLLLEKPYNEEIRRFEDSELLGRLLSVARVYSTKQSSMIVNCDYSDASHPRKDVREDYFAYLNFEEGGFWHRMCTYRFFLEEREHYHEYGKTHYAKMYKRYDLLLMYKLLKWFGKFF